MNINDIISRFCFEGELVSVKEFGSGHINKTYIADFSKNKYVLQQINTNVFKNPDELMNNVFGVTDFLREKIKLSGGDYERETLNFIKTTDGKKYLKTPEGECFRAYLFVKNSVSFDSADTPELFERSGAAFGSFQRMLADYPAESLAETIPHFHDTPWRYENEFLPAIDGAEDEVIKKCSAEIDYIKSRKEYMGCITELLKNGEIPLRVTHNDTKLNNVLFDESTGRALAVIDLDTVMAGSALYDFGDAIRYGANPAAEDERDLNKIHLDLDYFRAYAKGFLSEAGESLNSCEKEKLALSPLVMTLELAMRFLADYLNGNKYFKFDYPEHNLVRARAQIKLSQDIEAKLGEMNGIIIGKK